MKRLFSTFCLLVGASVASYAGVITTATGTNLLGLNSALIDFESNTAFPSGSFNSLPQFTASNGVTVTVAASGPGGAGQNTGTQAAISNQFTGYYLAGSGNPGLAGKYLTTFNNNNPIYATGTNFARTITLTFGGSGISEILFDYFGSDGVTPRFNTFAVDGVFQANLENQPCSASASTCPGNGRQLGYTGPNFTSITLTIAGLDNGGAGDQVLIDSIRVVGAAGTSGSSASSSSSNGGAVPEPSTYALMGAGLLALGYARRKK